MITSIIGSLLAYAIPDTLSKHFLLHFPYPLKLAFGASMDYIIKEIKRNKNKPRIYLDGLHAARAGFAPGDTYELLVEDGIRLTLIVHKDGSRTITGKPRVVTGRIDKRTGKKSIPVIDLNSIEALGQFEGMSEVRMIVREGSIVFLPLASELAKKERLDRLANKIANNEPIKSGDLTHGVGILGNAIHQGLVKAGLAVDTAFINEIREDLLTHSMEHNDIWNENTIGIAAPMQELVQDQWLMNKLPKVEMLSMSLPCSGASRAGASKLKLEKMEDHEHVGHLVYAALVILSKVQPAVVLLENVEQYKTTASASILRKQLTDMGYGIHEAVLNGRDFGCLEQRVRWCMVAVTHGLYFDFDQILPEVTVVSRVGDIMEQIPLDAACWTDNKGLKAKEQRDIEAGKGFRLPIVDANSTSVPTLRKHYQKKGSCDVQVQHPTDPEKARLFTGTEHLRLKGIDPSLLGDASDAMKHQAAGQAVQPPVFIPIGTKIGITMLNAQPFSKLRRQAVEAISRDIGKGISYEPTPNILSIAQHAIAEMSEADKAAVLNPITPSLLDIPKARKTKLGGGGIG